MNKLLMPGLSIIAAVGLYFLFISPTWLSIQALQQKEIEFDGALSQARQVESLLSKLESSYTNISREDLKSLELILPTEIDTTRIVKNIANIAQRHDIRFTEIGLLQPERKRDESQGYALPQSITFDVAARYDAFISFLIDVEQSLQISDIAKLQFETAAENLDSVNPNEKIYVLTLDFYSFERQ